MDMSNFSVNMREGEYEIVMRVTGEIRQTIKADNLEDAKAKANAGADKIEAEGCVELDSIEDIEIDHVYKSPPMYRVVRGGRNMQVSRLLVGDLPRDPDEYGF